VLNLALESTSFNNAAIKEEEAEQNKRGESHFAMPNFCKDTESASKNSLQRGCIAC
jgi:hypothetical protein